jgi:hypothetical protein
MAVLFSETRFAEAENPTAYPVDKRAGSAPAISAAVLRDPAAKKAASRKGAQEDEKRRRVERFGANAATDLYLQFALTP